MVTNLTYLILFNLKSIASKRQMHIQICIEKQVSWWQVLVSNDFQSGSDQFGKLYIKELNTFSTIFSRSTVFVYALCNFIKNETTTQMLSCGYFKIFGNIYFFDCFWMSCIVVRTPSLFCSCICHIWRPFIPFFRIQDLEDLFLSLIK